MIRRSTRAAIFATVVRTTAGSGPTFASPTGSEQSVVRRPGYTLIEMLIVCAVLAAIAGMSWPAMRGVLSKGRLRKGADDIETTIRKTRIRAIRDGQTFVFRYEPGGRRYRVESWETMSRSEDRDFAEQEPLATDAPGGQFPVARGPVTEELPAGVRFLPGGSPSNSFSSEGLASDGFARDDTEVFPERAPTELLSAELSQEPSDFLTESLLAESNWSEPIIFRANGRSENTVIRLIDDRRFVVDVKLRGLTGTVTSTLPVRLRAEQDPLAGASDDRFGSSEIGAAEEMADQEGRP